MNDCTKEELEELLDGIEWKLGEGQANELTIPLREKLQYMIDNYCDQKKILGYACDPKIYNACDHNWRKLERASDLPQVTICTKCLSIHFLEETADDNQ